jgi:hypothetical protein
VVDQTGLTGRYDYVLDIAPYFSEESRKAAEQDSGALPDAKCDIGAERVPTEN